MCCTCTHFTGLTFWFSLLKNFSNQLKLFLHSSRALLLVLLHLERKQFCSPNNWHCFLKVFIDIDEISPKLFLFYTTELWFLTSLLSLFLLSLQGMELHVGDKNHTVPWSATKESRVAVLTVPVFGIFWIMKHKVFLWYKRVQPYKRETNCLDIQEQKIWS